MTEETLSDKIVAGVHLDVKDVKNSIGKLKEELGKMFEKCDIEEIKRVINKIFGDDLI